MKNNAFYLSFEAMLSLLVLVAVVSAIETEENDAFENLYILQKEHDLLKIWAKKKIPMLQEMASDFMFAFPKKGGKVGVNNVWVRVGKQEGEAVCSSMNFFDSKISKKNVSVCVFKQNKALAFH